jgi:DNA-binding SARP family transcriptional activator/pimeloyl-ACP methyl ester carboxylesterase
VLAVTAGGEDMIIRVLGEVSLVDDTGTVLGLPGARQPALLAALAARAGQTVSADRLVDLLWPDAPPDNPAAALHSTVFKLRASLARVTPRDVLLTRELGYQLDLGPDDLDATVFADLVERARDQPPEEAAETLAHGLELWRGRAYEGFADSDVAQLEALRLEELRRTAVERCAEAWVHAGRPDTAVTLLRPFVAEHPLRSTGRLWLMRALDAQGRTADALEEYRAHRDHLADELGLEPPPELQEAHLELLRGERRPPSGTSTASAATPATTAARSALDPGLRRRGLPGMQVRYLRTDSGSVLAYGTTGQGPKLVVILGWISSLEVIASGRDPRSSVLERLADDLSLTLFDRAGTGLSPGPVRDHGLEASVAELTEVVRAVGPPVSLMAMSAGGPIALTLAHRRPEWVDSLVLFGTFADAPRTFTDPRLKELVVDIARTSWGIGSKILADLYRPGLSDEAAWHLAEVFRDSAAPDVAADYLEALFTQDVSPLLREIEAPALVLHYRGDRLVGYGGGKALALGLPDATFLPLEGRVHLPDAKDLDTIERAILDHVRTHATTAYALSDVGGGVAAQGRPTG